jgi:hypothetical protein
MTKQREGRGSKRCILTTTFRSWYNKTEGWALALKIVKTANSHMIHLKTPCRGSIHMPNRKEIDSNHDL